MSANFQKLVESHGGLVLVAALALLLFSYGAMIDYLGE